MLHRKAYGNRALIPKPEPMTLDTVFDCASLTKVIATTSSLMKLFEQGKFRLNDRITQYIPEFRAAQNYTGSMYGAPLFTFEVIGSRPLLSGWRGSLSFLHQNSALNARKRSTFTTR